MVSASNRSPSAATTSSSDSLPLAEHAQDRGAGVSSAKWRRSARDTRNRGPRPETGGTRAEPGSSRRTLPVTEHGARRLHPNRPFLHEERKVVNAQRRLDPLRSSGARGPMQAARRMTKAARSHHSRLSSPSGHASVIALVVGLTLLAFSARHWERLRQLGRSNGHRPKSATHGSCRRELGIQHDPYRTLSAAGMAGLGAALARTVGVNSMAFHAASLLGHLVNAWCCVYAVAWSFTANDASEPRARFAWCDRGVGVRRASNPCRSRRVGERVAARPPQRARCWPLFCGYLRSRLVLAIVAYADCALAPSDCVSAFPISTLAIDVLPASPPYRPARPLRKLPFAGISRSSPRSSNRALARWHPCKRLGSAHA